MIVLLFLFHKTDWSCILDRFLVSSLIELRKKKPEFDSKFLKI